MALDAIQLLGGNGYINEYPTGRLLRDAKLYEIGAGTSEIRRWLIGRELMGIMHEQDPPRLDTASPEYAANRAAMQALIDDLNARLEEIALGGGAANNARHQARGKLLPRAHQPAAGPAPLSRARRWPAGRSMTNRCPPPASSPVSAGSLGACVCWW